MTTEQQLANLNAEEKTKMPPLTEEQKAKIPEYKAKWEAILTCTEPANRAEAEDGIRLVYEAADVPQPSKIFWFPSPKAGMSGLLTYFYAHNKGIAIKDLTEADIEAALGDENSFDLDAYYQSKHNNKLILYDFYENECGLEKNKSFAGMKKVAMNAGYWWACESAVFICERPNIFKTDENNNLHNEDGPAASWSNEYSLYYIHGVEVPALVIEHPEQITVDMIDNESDENVRRIMIERYGTERYLKDGGRN